MIRGKISRCDPCKSDWKAKINELWAKYQNVVKSIGFMYNTYYPDGDGKVTLPNIDITGGVGLLDNTTFWTLITSPDGNAILTDKTTYYQLDVI